MNTDRPRRGAARVVGAAFVAAVIAAAGIAGLACSESLPTYVEPQNVLKMEVSNVEQLNDRIAPPGRQMVRIRLSGTNVFEEPFQDSADIRGTMTIRWLRQSGRIKTIQLSDRDLIDPSLIQGGKMTLIPGQTFTMEVDWDMKTDDGLYLPYLMNYAYLRRRVCAPNIACSDPEQFAVETKITIYNYLGEIDVPVGTFTFVGRTTINP